MPTPACLVYLLLFSSPAHRTQRCVGYMPHRRQWHISTLLLRNPVLLTPFLLSPEIQMLSMQRLGATAAACLRTQASLTSAPPLGGPNNTGPWREMV
jgi:hypothetical protein